MEVRQLILIIPGIREKNEEKNLNHCICSGNGNFICLWDLCLFQIFWPTDSNTEYPDENNCRQGNVLEGVHRQARFTVLSTCEKVVGIVHDMKGTKEDDDGDYQFNLDIENQYKNLLNEENIKQAKGMLVIEIIPKDQDSSLVRIPKNGDTIQSIWSIGMGLI